MFSIEFVNAVTGICQCCDAVDKYKHRSLEYFYIVKFTPLLLT